MEKFINKLTKDISKRTGIMFTSDIEYIKLCLKMVYWKGKVDSTEESKKIYKQHDRH